MPQKLMLDGTFSEPPHHRSQLLTVTQVSNEYHKYETVFRWTLTRRSCLRSKGNLGKKYVDSSVLFIQSCSAEDRTVLNQIYFAWEREVKE
ncbi:hypothetical protein TNCV_3229771 [Trichonephila clavipes]|nr:hypothetical protein TNCV_3229771 [Trichonephila clavipes]